MVSITLTLSLGVTRRCLQIFVLQYFQHGACVCCVVGLTRIELVTSSLSGMRSNQLSYSPVVIRGLARLLLSFTSLNYRIVAGSHFFFKHGNANSTDEVGNQIENSRHQYP